MKLFIKIWKIELITLLKGRFISHDYSFVFDGYKMVTWTIGQMKNRLCGYVACKKILALINVSGMTWTFGWIREQIMWITCMLRQKIN